MPRYFLTPEDGSDFIRDEIGIYCSGQGKASRKALKTSVTNGLAARSGWAAKLAI
jgi:hypothetical protein